jgi:hypothetical protein
MASAPAAPGPGILREIRTACRDVLATAGLVAIDDDALARVVDAIAPELGAATLARESGAPATDDPWDVRAGAAPGGRSGDEQAVATVLALAAVNFGSGYHPHVVKEPGLSGARTMATRLRRWADATPLSAPGLAAVSTEGAHELFGQPPDDGPRSELMGLFAAALNDLGNLVDGDYGGSFMALVADARRSAASLVAILARMPFFRDVSPYRGRIVPFYKRAQLAAADLDRAFGGDGPGTFRDLDELTAFADNLVPHVLRVDGVLHYDEALVARIDAGELLVAGSEEEVEIRAAAVHGVERLRHALAERGIERRSSDLDLWLWRRGGAPRYKALPRHRSRSVFY